MEPKRLVAAALGAALVLLAAAIVGLDPSPIVLLRGSDFSTLSEGTPKVAVEGLQRFESFKITPAVNYHSGRRNDVFYVSEDGPRLVFEYSSNDRTQKTLDVAWLLNHSFVLPRIAEAGAASLGDGFQRLPLNADGYLRLEFVVEGLREGMNDLHLVLDSTNDPLQTAGSEVARLNRAHLIHMNVIFGSYRGPTAEMDSVPDVSRPLPDESMVSELTVLARGHGLAVLNPDARLTRAVMARPAQPPEYLTIAPRHAETYREAVPDEGSVVVLLNPYMRLQDRWGRPSDGEDIAYTFRPLLARAADVSSKEFATSRLAAP